MGMFIAGIVAFSLGSVFMLASGTIFVLGLTHNHFSLWALLFFAIGSNGLGFGYGLTWGAR